MSYNAKNYTEAGGEVTHFGGKVIFDESCEIHGAPFPQLENQAESSATTVAALKDEHNSLLRKLKAAGIMASDPAEEENRRQCSLWVAPTFSEVNRMIITLEEMKQYLRVDYDDDDNLIETFIAAAEKLCADVARISVDELHDICDDHIRTAVLYSVAYLYEHREEADHHELTLTLRSLLFGVRKEGF